MSLYNPSEYQPFNKLWAIKHFCSSCEAVVTQSLHYVIRVKAVTSHKTQSVAKSNMWLGGLGIPDITVQPTSLRPFTSLASFANINDRCEAANLILTWICITVTTMLFWGKHEMMNWMSFWLGERLHGLNRPSVVREELDNMSKWLHQTN